MKIKMENNVQSSSTSGDNKKLHTKKKQTSLHAYKFTIYDLFLVGEHIKKIYKVLSYVGAYTSVVYSHLPKFGKHEIVILLFAIAWFRSTNRERERVFITGKHFYFFLN